MSETTAQTPVPEQGGDRWEGRPWVARIVRALVMVVPFVASVAVAFVLSQLVPPAVNAAWLIARLALIAAVATVALKGTHRVMRRLLPLAALLDLTLLFPDQAPSRYRMAVRNGASNVELQERIDRYTRSGETSTAAAAEHLLDLVAALSVHDHITRGHSERVRAYSQMIGEEMGLSGLALDRLRWAGLIHDVGKLQIPTEILNKPGKLTYEEFEVIKLHPQLGAELAAPLAAWLGESVLAVLQHHEKWDGSGYPAGLRGTEISQAGRIVAVADVFDVLTSVRSYKQARSAVEARAELARCAGAHFDPVVVRAFMNLSLGRLRFVMGPLSWIAQLSLFPQSLFATATSPLGVVSAATANSAATTAAGLLATSMGAMALPMSAGQTLRPPTAHSVAYENVDGAVSMLDARPTSAKVTVSAGADTPTGEGSGADSTTTSDPLGSTASPEQPPRPTPGGTTTTSTAGTTTTSTPGGTTTTLPPPSPSTTSPLPSTTSPSLPTLLPTSLPPTTLPPTTLPPIPPIEITAAFYSFASPVAGDTVSQEVLPTAQRLPRQILLPNYDTDRDAAPGLLIQRGGAFALGDPVRLQRFRIDPIGEVQLRGGHDVHLWVAPATGNDRDMEVAIALVRCIDANGGCTVVASRSKSFKGDFWAFELVKLDLGRLMQVVPADEHLEVWVTADASSESDLLVAYDAGAFISGLQIKQ